MRKIDIFLNSLTEKQKVEARDFVLKYQDEILRYIQTNLCFFRVQNQGLRTALDYYTALYPAIVNSYYRFNNLYPNSIDDEEFRLRYILTIIKIYIKNYQGNNYLDEADYRQLLTDFSASSDATENPYTILMQQDFKTNIYFKETMEYIKKNYPPNAAKALIYTALGYAKNDTQCDKLLGKNVGYTTFVLYRIRKALLCNVAGPTINRDKELYCYLTGQEYKSKTYQINQDIRVVVIYDHKIYTTRTLKQMKDLLENEGIPHVNYFLAKKPVITIQEEQHLQLIKVNNQIRYFNL